MGTAPRFVGATWGSSVPDWASSKDSRACLQTRRAISLSAISAFLAVKSSSSIRFKTRKARKTRKQQTHRVVCGRILPMTRFIRNRESKGSRGHRVARTAGGFGSRLLIRPSAQAAHSPRTRKLPAFPARPDSQLSTLNFPPIPHSCRVKARATTGRKSEIRTVCSDNNVKRPPRNPHGINNMQFQLLRRTTFYHPFLKLCANPDPAPDPVSRGHSSPQSPRSTLPTLSRSLVARSPGRRRRTLNSQPSTLNFPPPPTPKRP